MPRQSDARDRMIQSAALLFRERGIEGTAFADVLQRSGAPRGSVYHHFPGGKQQLAEEATRWASKSAIPVAVEVSALSGENVDEMFSRLARMILTYVSSPSDSSSASSARAVDGAMGRPARSTSVFEPTGSLVATYSSTTRRRISFCRSVNCICRNFSGQATRW